MKNAYNYDPVTGVFLGATPADVNPMRPNEYLLPANATFLRPPNTQPRQRAVFKTVGWVVEDIPPPPAPEAPYTDPKVQRREDRDAALKSIVVNVEGMQFQGGPDSQRALLAAIATMAQDGDVRAWVLADNSVAEVTRSVLSDVLKASVAEADRLVLHYNGLR